MVLEKRNNHLQGSNCNMRVCSGIVSSWLDRKPRRLNTESSHKNPRICPWQTTLAMLGTNSTEPYCWCY